MTCDRKYFVAGSLQPTEATARVHTRGVATRPIREWPGRYSYFTATTSGHATREKTLVYHRRFPVLIL